METTKQEIDKHIEREPDDGGPIPTRAQVLLAAKQRCTDGELEVDDNAIISRGDDPGQYVAAWLWVPDEEANEIETDEEPTPPHIAAGHASELQLALVKTLNYLDTSENERRQVYLDGRALIQKIEEAKNDA